MCTNDNKKIYGVKEKTKTDKCISWIEHACMDPTFTIVGRHPPNTCPSLSRWDILADVIDN